MRKVRDAFHYCGGLQADQERDPQGLECTSHFCGSFSVFANIMYLSDEVCPYPNVEHLDLLVNMLPGACFVIYTRNVTEWLNLHKHYGAIYRRTLQECPGVVDWYIRHDRHVHATLVNHRCAIEVNIDDPETGTQLADYLGGAIAECWAQQNKSPRP